MADNVTGLPKRGKTYSGGTATSSTITSSALLEGTEINFKDDVAVANQPRRPRSGRFVTARLVRNVSGAALLPGRLVTWQALYRGRRVDGYARTDGVECAGVVDDRLPSGGVADQDLFWLLREGPVLIKTPLAAGAGSVFTEGDVLVALTAVTSGATTSGRPAVLVTNSTAVTASLVVNRIGRVMSAMTTAQTNSSMLIDLLILG